MLLLHCSFFIRDSDIDPSRYRYGFGWIDRVFPSAQWDLRLQGSTRSSFRWGRTELILATATGCADDVIATETAVEVLVGLEFAARI